MSTIQQQIFQLLLALSNSSQVLECLKSHLVWILLRLQTEQSSEITEEELLLLTLTYNCQHLLINIHLVCLALFAHLVHLSHVCICYLHLKHRKTLTQAIEKNGQLQWYLIKTNKL
jgi:hypothetical protein